MKPGLGLYRHMLTPENFRFARQAGCTHVIVHLVDYFHQGGGDRQNQPVAPRPDGAARVTPLSFGVMKNWRR